MGKVEVEGELGQAGKLRGEGKCAFLLYVLVFFL